MAKTAMTISSGIKIKRRMIKSLLYVDGIVMNICYSMFVLLGHDQNALLGFFARVRCIQLLCRGFAPAADKKRGDDGDDDDAYRQQESILHSHRKADLL